MSKNVSHDPKRGFVLVDRPDRRPVYVRKGFHLVPCNGEAHSNAYIDNCMICAPLWGDVAVPAWVHDLSHYSEAAHAVRGIGRWLRGEP